MSSFPARSYRNYAAKLAAITLAMALTTSCDEEGGDGVDAGDTSPVDTREETGSDIAPEDGSAPACPSDRHTEAVDWQPAFDATDHGAFLSVWGTGPDDVYTVGGQPEVGVLFHFDGTGWSEVEIPDGPLLNWVHGGPDGELWLVGDGGFALRGTIADGFVEVETPTERPLWGVWVSSDGEVWAVGGDGREGVPVLLRLEGTSFAAVEYPETERPSHALFKIWGTRSDHVFAVGQFGLVYHWDGETWTERGAGTGSDLISLWGISDDEIAMIGGRSNGVLARWDGADLASETLSGLPAMNGIWMDGEGASHVVGVRGTVARIDASTFDFEREETDTIEVLHGIWGDGCGTRYAVGGSLDLAPPYIGVVLVDP